MKESTIEDADTYSIRTRVYKSSILLINAVSRSLDGREGCYEYFPFLPAQLLLLFSRVQNAARLLLLTGRKEEIGHFFRVSRLK